MKDQAIKNTSPMASAVQEFKAWLEAEGISLIVDQDNKITISLNNSTNTQNTTTNNQEESNKYKLAIDIAKRLQQGISVAQVMLAEINDPNVIDVNKKFSELIKEGPKTAAEYKLIEAVDTFLSPQDKNQAINGGFTVGEVITKVNASIEALQEATQAIMPGKQQEENKQHKQQEHSEKMRLGDPLPGLDQLFRNIIKGLEAAHSKALEAAQDQSKASEENKSTDKINSLAKPNSGVDDTITFESVTTNDITNSRSMPNANTSKSPSIQLGK